MNTRVLLLTVAVLLPATTIQAQRPPVTMPAFASDSAMMRYLRRIIAERERGPSRRMAADAMMGAPAASAAPMAGSRAAAPNEAITNVQHAGVDEGDIVKLHGDYLVILRRGRLFTVSIANGALRPSSMSDAYARGIDPGGTWYDEMLISGDKVVVIGYSYERGGTEAGIFRLDADGSLHSVATFQLRSNDYYSSRNYASRLIGSKLVFYAPLSLPWSAAELRDALPAVQRWTRQASSRGFTPIVRGDHVYRPQGWRAADEVALHTVTSCDLSTPDVQCEASVVIGPPGNVFYVSPSAVYVWMTSWRSDSAGTRAASMMVRMPLDGSAPSAVRVTGSPVDQFSFLESDGYVNVLTRANGSGDGMWSGEEATGPASLLRFPIVSLGDGSRRAARWYYRPLPTPATGTFQNRFVGDWLLYGSGSGWGNEEQSDRLLYAVPFRGGDPAALRLAHGTDRIEAMGGNAVIVGVRGSDLEFTGIRLAGRPAIAQRYTMRDAAQGELRSHGFFYRPDSGDTGLLGLPIREAERPGYSHLVEGSASVLFLRNSGGRFTPLGRLAAGDVRNADDRCKASCVDWYGNARPIFARGRALALMGYELVEGEVQGGRMREVRRVSFAPGPALASR